MTKNDLITIIINSPSINETLSKVEPYDLQDDFRQHFYLQVCEITFEKLLEVYNRGERALEAFGGGIIKNQLKSHSSTFHKTFRQPTAQIIEPDGNIIYASTPVEGSLFFIPYNHIIHQEGEYDYRIDRNYQKIISFLNHIHPKKSKLFIEHYINGKTLKQISKQYKIKYRTVHHSIRTTEKLIRNSIKFETD